MERIEMLEKAESLALEYLEGVVALNDVEHRELSSLRTSDIAVHTLAKRLLESASADIDPGG